ncbi:MAG: SDR family oxidoreductase [Erythrobacter sp.]
MSKPTVLVTGGATRIGAAIARRFAEAGWHTIIHHSSSSDEAQKLIETLPSAEIVQCDFLDEGEATKMIAGLAAKHSDWRVLINSAAIFAPDEATALDPQTFDRAMKINAKAPAQIAQAFLASAQSQTGRTVINLTDMKIENPNPDFFSYTMSKHALASTIEMLAMGAAGAKDRVYGIAPGAILASHDQTDAETEISHRLNLLARKTGTDEIADTALFLSQGYLRSGSTVFVDSGQHLLSQPRDVIYLARDLSRP